MVQSTHDVVVGDTEVVKRFRPTHRDEATREWDGLRLIARHAPGLAAEPIRFDPASDAPVVVMSTLPGGSLGSDRLSTPQVAAVGRALRSLFGAVPDDELGSVGERRSGPRELAADVRAWCREPHEPCSPLAESVLSDAARWLDGPAADVFSRPLAERVFGLGDGNVGNFIWDGRDCRLVDFEDCGVSDPAYEVADVVEHVTVTLPGLLDADEFVAGFRFDRDQSGRLLQFRRLLAMFWLLMLLPGNPGHARNPAGSVERQSDLLRGLLDR